MYKVLLTDARDKRRVVRRFDSYDAADSWLAATANRWRNHGYTCIEEPDQLTTVSPYGFWQTYELR